MHLETERLLLRPIQTADIPALVRLWSDPDVTHFMGGPRDRESLEAAFEDDLIARSSSDYDLWPVIEKSSSQLVGHCGLLDKDIDGRPEVELVYVLAKSAWGKGYATEMALALKHHAERHMELPRVVSLIAPENVASQRVAERAGMCFVKAIARPGGEVMRLYVVDLGTQGSRATQPDVMDQDLDGP
jgi:RimJ/RimL family protein N-acetyltransferase